MSTFPSDIEIAQNATMSHIKDIAKKISISEDDLEFYGKYKAKLPLHLQQENPKGKLILVLKYISFKVIIGIISGFKRNLF